MYSLKKRKKKKKKGNNRETENVPIVDRYPNFMDLTGLVSVRTSLSVIIMYA